MSKIGIGVIGAGMFGLHHIESFQAHPEAAVVHVANRGAEARLAAQARYGIARASADALDLIADPAVDAVVVATPPFAHAAYGLAALAAGKHLLLEKPMAATRADARRLAEAAAARPGLVALEASCRHTRLHGKFKAIRDFVAGGAIGTVYHVHLQYAARFGFAEYNPNGLSWCLERAKAGGGQVADMGEYDLGFHLGLLGDPAARVVGASAAGGLRAYPGRTADIEQHAVAWLECEGGASLCYERGGPVHCDLPEETRVYGSRGGLRFSWPSWRPWSFEWFRDDGERRPIGQKVAVEQPEGQSDDADVAAHFMDCLAGRATPAMGFDLALRHFSLCQDIVDRTRLY